MLGCVTLCSFAGAGGETSQRLGNFLGFAHVFSFCRTAAASNQPRLTVETRTQPPLGRHRYINAGNAKVGAAGQTAIGFG